MKCISHDCSKDAIWRVLEVRNRAMVRGDDAFCEDHAKLLWDSHLSDQGEGSGEFNNAAGIACYELELVMADYRGYSGKMLLREVGTKRFVCFPIGFVGIWELYYAVQDSPYHEFTLHVAMKRLVEHVGGTLSHVVVHSLNPAGYFEASAVVLYDQEAVRLRVRPSDGLVLAILTNIPFVVEDEVVMKVAEAGFCVWGVAQMGKEKTVMPDLG